MNRPLQAQDLLPLIERLSHEEQLRLARLALRAATDGSDAAAYEAAPPRAEEFSSDEDPLAWDGEGWENVDAPR